MAEERGSRICLPCYKLEGEIRQLKASVCACDSHPHCECTRIARSVTARSCASVLREAPLIPQPCQGPGKNPEGGGQGEGPHLHVLLLG